MDALAVNSVLLAGSKTVEFAARQAANSPP